jgi:hypothetical protein
VFRNIGIYKTRCASAVKNRVNCSLILRYCCKKTSGVLAYNFCLLFFLIKTVDSFSPISISQHCKKGTAREAFQMLMYKIRVILSVILISWPGLYDLPDCIVSYGHRMSLLFLSATKPCKI